MACVCDGTRHCCLNIWFARAAAYPNHLREAGPMRRLVVINKTISVDYLLTMQTTIMSRAVALSITRPSLLE